jgi:hypothetical protein
MLRLAFAALVACGDAEPGLAPLAATLADCGSGLDVLLDESRSAAPRLEAPYSEALASWPAQGRACGLGVFSGQCADGKRLLYRNGGFGSMIRYFEGERLVGYVLTSDVGTCPSVCPFSHYYGAIDGVRCDAPSFEDLCTDSSSLLDVSEVLLPFADGQPPGGCDE